MSTAQETAELSVRILYAIYLFITLPGLILFILRRHIEPIKSRGWILAVLQVVTQVITMTLFIPGSADTSCFLQVMEAIVTIPVACFPYFIRGWMVWYNYKVQSQYVREEQELSGLMKFLTNRRWTANTKFQIICYIVLVLIFVPLTLLLYFYDGFVHPEVFQTPQEFYYIRCFTTHSLVIIFIEFGISVVLISFALLGNLFASETYYIRVELLCVLLCGGGLFLVIIGALVTETYPSSIDYSFWSMLIFIIFSLASLWMPVYFSFKVNRVIRDEMNNEQGYEMVRQEKREKREKEKREKHDSNGNQGSKGSGNFEKASRSLSEEDLFLLVIEDEVLGRAFEKFAIQSWCVENLIFYRVIQKFKESPSAQLKQEAERIWKRFFAKDAPCEINVVAAIREKIMEQMLEGNIDTKLFDAAEKEVITLLKFTIYPLWKNSAQFESQLKRLQWENLETLREVKKKRKSIVPEDIV